MRTTNCWQLQWVTFVGVLWTCNRGPVFLDTLYIALQYVSNIGKCMWNYKQDMIHTLRLLASAYASASCHIQHSSTSLNASIHCTALRANCATCTMYTNTSDATDLSNVNLSIGSNANECHFTLIWLVCIMHVICRLVKIKWLWNCFVLNELFVYNFFRLYYTFYMKSVAVYNKRLSQQFTFDRNALKLFVELRIRWKCRSSHVVEF